MELNGDNGIIGSADIDKKIENAFSIFCFDVIVIGGGHAGIEASLACARMGIETAIITLSAQSIGRMSCNPAIGGVGKGQIVREIDALGGEMGKAADATGIQFKMLNRGNGPAVWSPRCQSDKFLYSKYMQERLLNQPGLKVIEDSVDEIMTQNGQVSGIRTNNGKLYNCKAVIVTTGTFLQALMHCGELKTEGGRIGEGSAKFLSKSLRSLGFELGRLKTGTPPRLEKKSINFSGLSVHAGDCPPRPFSYFTESIERDQILCWITRTNPETHRLVAENLDRAPMYTGQIKSTGPRYCPSFETKVIRFRDKDHHQVFLEPEGLDSESIYCNGISTSTPPDVQEKFVRTITGLERAEFLRYGYAVEYDFVYPHQIKPTMETKKISGLYFAGQINGTSGYEEAAGQGLIAGINAALKIKGEPEFVPSRSESCIGVMVDDLTTKSELTEPYRMFTSMLEYRLLIRQDNADRRLMRYGHRLGLIPPSKIKELDEAEQSITDLKEYLKKKHYGSESLYNLLKRPENKLDTLTSLDSNLSKMIRSEKVREQVEVEVKYEGYIKRQQQDVERFNKMEKRFIDPDFDYLLVPHLRYEAREKLSKYRPTTIGQSSRITGISPADIQILLAYMA